MSQYNQSIRGKLYQYFHGKLGIKKSTKNWWRCDCIWCGGHHSMGIQLEDSKVHCFKCLENSNPIKLLMEIEGFQVFNEARNFLSIQQEYESYSGMVQRTKIEFKPIELPESYRLITNGSSMVSRAARGYLKKRGFDITKLAMAGVGYCTAGEYAGYIIFPYYRKGSLVYYQGRLFMGGGPKMKNPLEEQFGVGKTQIIYNEDALFIYNRIYAMESITNCLTLGDRGIGLNGKKISPWQMSRIIDSPCKSVIIILDRDAWAEALDMALKMVHHKKIKIVKMPNELDVNDLGKKKTLKLVRAEHYQKYMDLYKLKLNMNERTIPPYQRVGPGITPTRGF